MAREPITLYKLIILFMLDKTKAPLTSTLISNYILTNGYTNYFSMQTALGELVEADLIHSKISTHKRTFYEITEAGKETLSLFSNNISPEIRDEIRAYLKENEFEITEEVSVIADYRCIRNNEYEAKCTINENGSSLLELKLCVPTEKEAEHICSLWKDKNDEIYQYLIQTLMD